MSTTNSTNSTNRTNRTSTTNSATTAPNKPQHRLLCRLLIAQSALTAAALPAAQAAVTLPAIFGSHMVLQRDQQNPIWGTADPAEKITLTIADQSHTTTATAAGQWRLALDPLPAGGPHTLTINAKNTISFGDVMVGEVWICSGQSNMAMAVSSSNDADLEIKTAKYPNLRLITVPNVGTQEPQTDFKGQWARCTPGSVPSFSAVGYFFGRQLLQTLDVPIGLINNSWGGSACEAWVRRDLLEADPRYGPLMDRWTKTEATFNLETARDNYKKKLDKWQADKDAGKKVTAQPRPPRNPLAGNSRPANLYNGVLRPLIGYGIRGAIWYQGESNAGRAYQYRHLFPLMIQNWRDDWKQGDFPFYWVQLADFRAETPNPVPSPWAELREAQTMTMTKLPNTGEAVIIDIGEAVDIHPKNKQDVGKRLARWALAKQYGHDIVYRSPIYQSMEVAGDRIVVTFDHVGGGLDTFDVNEPIGFAIAGGDQKFIWADAKLLGKDKIEVWSDAIKAPVAVRYAWAENPVCNVQNRQGLPLTPFRTDTWPGITADKK